jgi:hypothetical protein
VQVLVDEAMVAQWVKEGLPSDPTSVQNGTILNNSERWPLIMDPQLQGIVWIKEREAKNGLKVVRMEDEKKVCVVHFVMTSHCLFVSFCVTPGHQAYLQKQRILLLARDAFYCSKPPQYNVDTQKLLCCISVAQCSLSPVLLSVACCSV